MPLIAVTAHDLLEEMRRSRVQPHHGLVQDEQLGLVEERAGQRQLLFHAVGIALDEVSGRI